MRKPDKSEKMQFGLCETPIDNRDFQLGAITKLPDLDELPLEFLIKPLRIKSQGSSDFCSAYMTCAMSEVQEGTPLEPSYSFAVSKEISGDKDAWGQNLRDACKAHLRGALPESISPFSIANREVDFLRDIANWSVEEEIVAPHRKQSFFKVTGQYDAFDNARASMWKFGSCIGTGVVFGWPLTKVYLDTTPQNGFGHAVTVCGFTQYEGVDVVIIQNSYGSGAGEQGFHYMPRDVYNYFADRFGQYMFVDIEKEDAKYKLENGVLLEDNWVVELVKAILTWIKSWFPSPQQ